MTASRLPCTPPCVAVTLIIAWLSSAVAADDAALPGWRQGRASWNGTGYDLPQQVPSPGQATDWDTARDTPYTVPAITGPTARQNPFVQDAGVDSNDAISSSVRPPASVDQSRPRSIESLIGAIPGSAAPPTTAVPARPSNTDSVRSDDESVPTAEQVDETAALNAPQQTTATDRPLGESQTSIDHEPAATPPSDSTALDPTDSEVEPPPLQEEVVRWYQYPRRWMKGWDSHAEFGIDGSDGNADTLAIQTGLELKRKSDLQTLMIDIDYRQASSRNATTENNGRLNVDYDRLIAETNWSGFGKLGLEWDRFKAFDLRINLNGGVGYHWIRDDDASLVTRFGAGASREIGAPDDDWKPEAVFGVDAERQLNSRNKVKGKIDYFPAWDDFSDFRLVADAAWEILLDDSENLSLKLAMTDRYDSTPQGAKPNDIYYSLLLLYKF